MRNSVIVVGVIAIIVIIAGTAYYALGSTNRAAPMAGNLSLSGMVYGADGVELLGATVTLYASEQDPGINGRADTPAPAENNPQTATTGRFSFVNLTEGYYNVTAEISGHSSSMRIKLGPSSSNLNITIPDYSYVPTGSLDPAPKNGPWGSLFGLVTDRNGMPVSNATVTIRAMGRDASGKYVNLGKAQVLDGSGSDPNDTISSELTSDGSKSEPGMYAFYRVPWGMYNVTAEKDGRLWSATAILGPKGQYGTARLDLCEAGRFDDISGCVNGMDNKMIVNATITIYNTTYDSATGTYLTGDRLAIKGNPQRTSNGTQAAPGEFTFYVVPIGTYNITAEVDGHTGYTIFDMNNTSTIECVITMTDYPGNVGAQRPSPTG